MKQSLDLDGLSKNFFEKCQSLPKINVAAVYPCSEDSLNGVVEAAEYKLIEPLLIGPIEKISQIADNAQIDISKYNILNVQNMDDAIQKAIELIHKGKADAIMKGNLHTDHLMKEIISKNSDLRTNRRISHAFVIATENYHKPFLVTDAAININPDLMTKRDIIQNAVDLMCLINKDIIPKVAAISAVETINPNIPSTIDAACLSKMSERGQITGAIVDGPFAIDNVVSLKAAATKNLKSPVIGDVDIFFVPNLEAGNMFAKELMYLTTTISAGIILGAKVPIILTSRADGVRSRIASCALAVIIANKK